MTRSAIFIATILAAAAAHSAPLATEGFVTNKIAAAISQIPPPDFSTGNTQLVATIEATAPTNDFVRKTGDVMTGSMTIAYDGNLLSVYPDSIYFSGVTGVNYIYWPDNIYGSGEIGYGDLHYRGGFDIFATREWAGHWAHATVTNTVPAWARAATKPAYTASEVGAVPTAGGILTGPLTLPRGIAAGGDAMFYGDGMKNLDNNAVYAWPTKSGTHHFALTSDIPDVPAWALAAQKPTYTAGEVGAATPAAVSNIVSTAYVREKLGVYLYVGEDGGIYVHTNED